MPHRVGEPLPWYVRDLQDGDRQPIHPGDVRRGTDGELYVNTNALVMRRGIAQYRIVWWERPELFIQEYGTDHEIPGGYEPGDLEARGWVRARPGV